jgi:hypothetical protein
MARTAPGDLTGQKFYRDQQQHYKADKAAAPAPDYYPGILPSPGAPAYPGNPRDRTGRIIHAQLQAKRAREKAERLAQDAEAQAIEAAAVRSDALIIQDGRGGVTVLYPGDPGYYGDDDPGDDGHPGKAIRQLNYFKGQGNGRTL